jgi:hypothetical protein
MNLDKKLELAHEYFQETISYIRKHDIKHNFSEIISESWEYADEMEKQYNKRKPIGLPDAIREIPPYNPEPLRSVNESEVKLEWQPDWSQAPNGFNYWVINHNGIAFWFLYKPKKEGSWFTNVIPPHHMDASKYAPSFNYQGDWKDSLRERPEEPKKQTYKCNCAHWKNSAFFMGDTFKCNDCGGMVTI